MVFLGFMLLEFLLNHPGKELEVYLPYVKAFYWFNLRQFHGLAQVVSNFADKHKK